MFVYGTFFHILIESQWNLNEVSIANKAQTEMILIESQWNLNDFEQID